ncbi:MAG: alpha-galactosidase [Clostridia bacterium]|nr:alpha-galactosidase [Clostridia bacterium]
MNIKNFSVELEYKTGDKSKKLSLEAGDVIKGYEDEDLNLVCLVDDSDAVHTLKLKLNAKKPLEMKSAQIIHDHFYGNREQFFANGYQSWTTSREFKRGDVQYGLRSLSKLPGIREISGVSGDYHFTLYGKDLYHSFTYTYLRDDSKVEFFGSLNERTGYTIFYADMKANVFVISKDVEGLTVEGEYDLIHTMHTVGTYDEVFDRYFETYPLKHTGRVDHFAGYTSWYNYFQNIDEKIILRDLEGLKRAGEAANIFQIDDGYETKVGDWDLDLVKFPNGMASVVDKIHAAGFKAGLWLAPFAAEFKANIVKTHPEWLIKTVKGKNQISGIAWNGFYALDIEQQEVRDYIRAYFDRVFDEWGFDMVKLDFLYAACIRPRNNKTRGQLMCEAMDFLRECCRDKIILGCGVPLGPSFGIVDACRISCDAELSFKERWYTKVTNQEIISAKMSMNNSIFRRHLNGRIMANDPDVFFLRDDGMKPAKFNMEQKKLLAKVNNMFGSVLFVSDDVNNYDDEKMQILLESYKKFDGKVLGAEYVSHDEIEIVYEKDGVKRALRYNTLTGVNTDKEI